ncbi:hypothetical protein B0T25DRAFT_460497 [Lasiosphaeria hispida]|uniref:Aminoglycoside phosphotransferase domain-containing protein n=1 Tax=Lasiosphaeria hispida TaxID=260671 RepID=A0AAJ0HAX3_9PEZI|nr:hypothetical protein B0T25DRAFT_460497 [Lasiosphaeria hispida]
MCRPPPEESVRAVLDRTLLPHISVEKVQGIFSLRLPRIYDVTTSNGRALQLVLEPPAMLRLLRFERPMVEAETVAVRWIRETVEEEEADVTSAASGARKGALLTKTGSHDDPEPLEPDLLSLVPTLVQSSPYPTNELKSAYAFFESVRGTPLSLLPSGPLSPPDRRHVDKQTGRLLRRLARLTSPTGKFGPVAAAVAARSAPDGYQHLGVVTDTWAVAFQSVLEGILRDGEDMGVTIPYAAVRRNFRRFSYALDSVAVPRLVVVNGAEEGNVLVHDPGSRKGVPDELESATKDDTSDTAGAAADGSGEVKAPGVSSLEVSGLLDWSNCVFGDPLLASVFADGASDGFLEGFNGTDAVAETSTLGLRISRTIVEGTDTAGVRLLLYQVYHAVICVVKEFYRPRVDSSRRELEARKRLNEVLAKLGEVHDDPKRSHQRPSGEMSPAKRIKPNQEGPVGRMGVTLQ